MHHDLERVKKAGYTVEQKSPWHYHVLNGKKLIDVWPTRKKWMVPYSGGASYYTNLLETCERVLGKPGQKRLKNPRWLIDKLQAEQDCFMTPVQKAAIEWRREWIPVLVEELTLP